MNRARAAQSTIAAAAAILFSTLAAGGDLELATDSPVATVETLQRGLATLAQHEDATIEQRYAALEPLIDATHDLPYIAEFALRRQWSALSDADRERFIAAFRRLSVTTYAARFANVGPDTFGPTSVAGNSGAERVEVSTSIRRSGAADVPMQYLLQKESSGWRIINIIADGVSDLALKRAEYQRLLNAGSIDGLIAELDVQAERLRKN